MKRLGFWLPRWNMLKTLLPVMEAARDRGDSVDVLCPRPPLTGAGKPELLAADHVNAFAAKWPWANWAVLAQAPGSWNQDAIIAHGVVHDGDLIRQSKVPWVALDHLHENAWWCLTGRPDLWTPFNVVCHSGPEDLYVIGPPGTGRATTGYTAFDVPVTADSARAEYGLPERYMLVGTAVQANAIPWDLWQTYFANTPLIWALTKVISGYHGPTYGQILQALKDYCRGTGMAMVGKSRWKHDDHPAHRLFDFHFQDDMLDPHRAYKLMAGATVYAGGLSGLACEARVHRIPTVQWAYYDPLALDHKAFRRIRRDIWLTEFWKGYYRLDQGDWLDMVTMLNETGPFPQGPESSFRAYLFGIDASRTVLRVVDHL